MENNKDNSTVPGFENGSKNGSNLESASRNQDSFSSRLKLRRENLSLTQSNLGKKIGVSTTSIQSYESGLIPKGGYLIELAKALDCSIDWLLLGENEPAGTDTSTSFDTIPLAETRLNAGGGNVVFSENLKEAYSFRKEWISRVATAKKNLILMFVEGDSMDPAINDGDIVMIDRGRQHIFTGKIYAIGVSDTIMIKRLELLPDSKVKIISDNRTYDPYIIEGKELRIIGQVIWFARELITRE